MLSVLGTTQVIGCSLPAAAADAIVAATDSAIASAGPEVITRLAAVRHFHAAPSACSKSGHASAIGKRAEPSEVTVALGGHSSPVPRILGGLPRSTAGFSPKSSPSTIAGGIGFGMPPTEMR